MARLIGIAIDFDDERDLSCKEVDDELVNDLSEVLDLAPLLSKAGDRARVARGLTHNALCSTGPSGFENQGSPSHPTMGQLLPDGLLNGAVEQTRRLKNSC